MFCVIAKSQIISENPSFQFMNLGVKQGLSNNGVTGITQDGNGFIWVTTVDGVNRLEGYRVKQYFNTPNDKNGLFNSDVGGFNNQFEDKLYIATQTGLACYDIATASFKEIDERHKTKLRDQKRIKMFRQQDTLWIFGSTNFYKLSKNDVLTEMDYAKVTEIVDTILHPFSNYVSQVQVDARGSLWAVNATFLMKINPKTMRVISYFKICEIETGHIQDIEIVGNKIYISTWGKGMWQLDIATNKLNKIVTCPIVCKDATTYFDSKNNPFLIIASFPNNSVLNLNNLQTTAIKGVSEARCVFVDKQNNVYFGTDSGVYFSNKINKNVRTINLKTIAGST